MSAFFFPRPFPACLFSFVRGSDISLPPRILLRRRASCFQPRAFVSCPCPVNVLSVSSQPLLNLLSVSSQPPHIVSLLECIASTHTSSLRTSSHRRRTRRSLHAFIIFPRSPCTYPQVNLSYGELFYFLNSTSKMEMNYYNYNYTYNYMYKHNYQ